MEYKTNEHGKLTVKELPASERPYEKFMSYGAEALSDAELLAVIIRTGTNGLQSIDVARNLLRAGGGGLLGLYEMSFDEMQRIRGIGRVKAIQLKCVAELSMRIAQARHQDRIRLESPRTIAHYYMEKLRHEEQEKLIVCLFDSKCHLLGDEVVTVGSVDTTIVSPREIFLCALRKRAVQIVLLHNHPSGLPEPSRQDYEVTEVVRNGGMMIGIMLIDHIVIGDGMYYSFAEHGKIDIR